MADDVKFAFIVTGVGGHSGARFFTVLAASQVIGDVRVLSKNKHRADSRITPPATVHFVLFDFESDAISYYAHSFAPTGRDGFSKAINKNPQSMWSASDPDVTFVTKSTPISILDVYHAVRNAPPHSVLQVDFYSHGFLEGPVLAANSNDTYENTPQQSFPNGDPQRDPNDQDGRARTDFARNMGEEPSTAGKGKDKQGQGWALDEFRNGFATGASFRVFGCNVQDVVSTKNGPRDLIRSSVFEVVRQVFDLPLKRNTALGATLRADKHAMPASVSIDLGYECTLELQADDPPNLTHAELLAAHAKNDPTFFAGLVPSGTIQRSYTDVVKYVAGQVTKTYIFKAADALTGITCFGAVPGTSGERELPAGDARTMHIPDFARYLKFFLRYLDIASNEPAAVRQRRYGLFDTATVAKIKAHQTGG